MIWLQGLLMELGFIQVKNVLHNDSQIAIHLAKNSTFLYREKHIDLQFFIVTSSGFCFRMRCSY